MRDIRSSFGRECERTWVAVVPGEREGGECGNIGIRAGLTLCYRNGSAVENPAGFHGAVDRDLK